MRKYVVCIWVSLLLVPVHGKASEVMLPYKSMLLNGNLELATGREIGDGVILMTHAGLAHNRMESYVYLQKLFKEHGYSTLAISFSLGVSNRHGMYDCKLPHRHRYADAADEIDAWVSWLEKQGVKRIVLFGHSRGGAQTALYAAQHDNKIVKAVVLLAPDTHETNDAKAYQQRHKKQLAPILEKAQQLVREGKGDTLMQHTDILYCSDTAVQADTFVSYYGPDPRLDTAYLIPDVKEPTLIVIGGGDEIIVNNDKFMPLADGNRVQVKVIDGAGHFFRDLYADDAVDEIDAFLQQNGFAADE